MIRRLVSAAIALPIAIILTNRGGWSFFALVSIVAFLAAQEFLGMALPWLDRFGRLLFAALTAGLVCGVSLLSSNPRFLLLLLVFLVGWTILYFVFRTDDVKRGVEGASGALLCLLWVGGLLAATGALRLLPEGRDWVLLACVASWGSDSSAYFVGRKLGKHPFCPRLSPKKTWEGSIAGMFTAAVGAIVLQRVTGGPAVATVSLVLVSVVASFLGQMGDLAESALKRATGTKDSGTIMPGHGGLLDRIDALLFVSPVLLAYAICIEGLSFEPALRGLLH
jgi:phosphatidate cytidylyltransferase